MAVQVTQPIPRQVGPVRIEPFAGSTVAVTCPRDFDPVMRRAGGQWQRATRVWLLERRRLGPVVRALRATTDPLLTARRPRPRHVSTRAEIRQVRLAKLVEQLATDAARWAEAEYNEGVQAGRSGVDATVSGSSPGNIASC